MGQNHLRKSFWNFSLHTLEVVCTQEARSRDFHVAQLFLKVMYLFKGWRWGISFAASAGDKIFHRFVSELL